MHIEADLDSVHTKRLQQLQRRWQQPLDAVLAKAIDHAWQEQNCNEKESGASLFQAFEQAGLLGAVEDDPNLSVNYKQHLDFSDKCGKSK